VPPEQLRYGNRAVWLIQFGIRTGKLDLAGAEIWVNHGQEYCAVERWHREIARYDLLLAELARLQGKPGEAHEPLKRAFDWGIKTADREILVWGYLIQARLALDMSDFGAAERAVREGLRIAEYCGYGLYWIDLVVARGHLHLRRGDLAKAEENALQALNGKRMDGSIPESPAEPEAQLHMLGARHPECGYAWGEGDALHLLGEALLAQGRRKEAREELEKCLALRERIQDYQATRTREILTRL